MTQIEAAFTTAKRVFEGKINQTQAANRLNLEQGINVNSAKIMIAVYAKMVRGLEFKRALSAPDMNYYLARFLADGGVSTIRKPVEALWKHIEYYEAKNNVTLNALRKLYLDYSTISKEIVSLDESQSEFMRAVQEVIKIPKQERQKCLESSSKLPKSRPVVVNVYERNPYVVVEVLERAGGTCEKCGSSAPFRRRKDNSPYLEVHHKVRLADGGEDTVGNAIALCPNCHRNLHFGPIET